MKYRSPVNEEPFLSDVGGWIFWVTFIVLTIMYLIDLSPLEIFERRGKDLGIFSAMLIILFFSLWVARIVDFLLEEIF
tara:strand:+ start:301 stop:534 length:234 start_codon:yes stop_codon:yes gene_type:complete